MQGESRLQEFIGLEKGGVVYITSPMPEDRPINLPGICAGRALPVHFASAAGNATLFQALFCSAHTVMHGGTASMFCKFHKRGSPALPLVEYKT